MTKKFIDIHTHKKAFDENIITIRSFFPQEFTNKTNIKSYSSVGIHPWFINENFDEDFKTLKEAIQNKNVIAVGEIGLDRISTTDLRKQKDCFIKQLELADEAAKPVVIHGVKTYSDLLSVKKRFTDQKWIIHGFKGNFETAEKLLDMNCYLSFGQTLFNSQSKAIDAIKEIHNEKIFFETDESDYKISEIYEKAAKLLSLSIDDLTEKIENNFKDVFGND